uniref:Uncharacterized protein n=1 Tax=Brugia malayi TaxID=6279 RepID=A8PDC1_BRUMA
MMTGKLNNKMIILTVTTLMTSIGAYKMGLMDWMFKKDQKGKTQVRNDGK